MSPWKRIKVRLGKCPYCGLHYLPPSRLIGHLHWAHASRRSEWPACEPENQP